MLGGFGSGDGQFNNIMGVAVDGANNVYDVVVTGIDAAGNVGTRAVAVTVTDVAEGGGATPGIALYQGAGQSNMGSLGVAENALPPLSTTQT